MNQKLRILHVEDDPYDAELIKRRLEGDGFTCDVTLVRTQDGLARALQDGNFDLILGDYTMPSFDGLSALALAQKLRPEIPYLFVSGTIGEERAIEALKEGATDYVLKDNPKRLATAVRRALKEADIRKERMEADRLFRESEERYRSVVENIGIGIALISPDLKILSLNNRMRTWFPQINVSEHPVCYRVFNIPSRDGICSYCPAIRTLKDGQVHEAETVTTAGNEIRHYRIVSSPVMDAVGAITAAIEMVDDITDRKRAEEAVKKREQQLSSVYDTVGDSIFHLTVEKGDRYRFLSVNKAFIKTTGIDYAHIIGKFVNEIIPEPSRTMVLEKYKAAIRDKSMVRWEETADYPAGRLIGDVSVMPVFDAEGNCTHLIGAVHNITDQKKLEDQLRQSHKMEAIGQLTGGIAHDFNNILSAIMGYGELLRGKLGTGNPLKADLEVILGAAEKAASLTHGLLAFSRKQILNAKPVDLKDIIKRVEKLLGRIIGEDIELTTTFKGGALKAVADMGQIEQVLMNLATNARDAMPKGGSLSISAEPVAMEESFIKAHGYGEPGKYALISVADTGTGMDEETQRKIFEPFFTTKEQGKGTGLGLSMVHGIVKQHNGYINVYSEPGKGTNFKIYLPLIGTADKAEEQALPLPPPQRGTETILVAEDDAALRRLSEIVLEEYGYTVILAENGEAAIRKFRERKDDIRLVILDMIMPKKSGRDAYEEIEKIRPGIKAIFSTGYTADRIVHDQALREKLDVILKPVSPLELLRKVREVLDR